MAFMFAAPFASNCNQRRSSLSQVATTRSIEPAHSKRAPTNICSNQLHGNFSPTQSIGSCLKFHAVPDRQLGRNVNQSLREEGCGAFAVQFRLPARAPSVT